VHAIVENILDQVRGAWRFRRVGMIVAWVVCLIGWAVVLVIPDTYQASGRVFVDTRTALRDVTVGIVVDSDVQAQIQLVRQALLGGPQLEAVAREAGMIEPGSTVRQRQAMLAALRDSIDISGSVQADNPTAGLYVISYTDRNRERALKLVDRLLNSFVESTMGGTREGSAVAMKFLQDQIADYERRLSAAESRLADFKKKHVALMSGTQGDYFARLQAEMDSVSKAQADLAIAQRRRVELNRQLHGEQPVLTAAEASVRTGAGVGAGNNDIATRIREAQARLDDLLLRFTEKHPDVIALRGTIAELKKREQAEIEAIRRGDPGAAARAGLNANPVFQNIQLQLNQADVEIAALRAQIADHETKRASLQGLVNTAPEVEAELKRLNRDYDVTRAQYNALVERLEKARLGEEANQSGTVRFQLIDPPTAAFTPVAPKRPLLVAVVLLAGLGLGIAVAYLLHQLKPIFTNARQLNEVTGLPVLGTVSMTWLDKYRVFERREQFVYAALAFVLIVLGGGMLVTAGRASQFVHRFVA
jgi:polysaccharide chain length determinant protein (PEP-CTERM system associated)